MKYLAPWGAMALAMAAMSPAALAQTAYTAKQAHLRAGPARDYPVVAVLPAGLEVAVQGCLSDYTWCDVVAGANRGWIYAGNINYAYQGNPTPVLNNGALFGIAMLGFVIGDYWGDHYRDRYWYRDRQRWTQRPVQPRPIPARPAPRPGHAEPAGPHPAAPPLIRPEVPRGRAPPAAGPGAQRPQPRPGVAPGIQGSEPPHGAERRPVTPHDPGPERRPGQPSR